MMQLLDHIIARDPAARSRLEVALTYPGFHAVVLHRAAHWLWKRQLKLVARVISNVSHILTGIEIHPGAQIGECCFIDHGTGVVIGETAVIGDRVTLFQSVTLGGVGAEQAKRHPTLGDDVMVGAGAKLLGAITIGAGAKIGANAVVLHDVPAGATAVGVPARVLEESAPSLADRVEALELRLNALENGIGVQTRVTPKGERFDA